MDPNATLAKALALAKVDWTGKETDELTPSELCKLHDAHMDLCERVQALDKWLSKGGFLPSRWERSEK